VITGVHALIFTEHADAVRAFFRDVLGFPSVDAGDGWLIFGLPPAELGVHPAGGYRHEISLMCDDLEGTVDELRRKGAEFSQPIMDEEFGRVTAIRMPGGGELMLYEPRHPTAPGHSPTERTLL
jgi:catechol 2,3-dioxygenase-like lactoylglutathione lyase family enzyme